MIAARLALRIKNVMKKLMFAFALALLLGATAVKADSQIIKSDGTPVYLLVANQCKEVVYSDWSPCMLNFNMQLRTIISHQDGCMLSTKQQVETLRYCDSLNYFQE